MSRDVDAIWAKLKASQPQPKGGGAALADKLMAQFNDGLSMAELESSLRGDGDGSSVAASSRHRKQQEHAGSSAQETPGGAGGASSAIAPPAPPASFDPQHVNQRLPQCISALQDPSQQARRRALEEIRLLLLSPHTGGEVAETTLSDWLEGKLGKALLRKFDDVGEANRELAVSTLSGLLQAAPDSVLMLLPYAMPVLEERLAWEPGAGKTPKEGSEEVRLTLTRLLLLLLELADNAAAAYAAEAVAIVKVLADDPFHEVNVEACSIVLALNASLGMRLQPAAKELVACLLPLTTHKRHRVRVAAIGAVGATMFQGAHEMILEMVAFRDPNVVAIAAFYGDDLKVNFCGKLALDLNPQVRLAFVHMLGAWMLRLPERMDHEHRLMPYLISALDDESTQVQDKALALLHLVGDLYIKDHAAEVEDMHRYLPEQAHGLAWNAGAKLGACTGLVYGGGKAVVGGGHAGECSTEESAGHRAPLVLPGPCTSRPALGTRMVVQANLSRSMSPLLNELQAWQEEPRMRAAILLRTSLVFAEGMVHQHLQAILPALCRVAASSDAALTSLVCDCAAIAAAFTPPELSLSLLEARLADGDGDAASTSGALAVLAAVVRGAGPRGTLDVCVPRVLATLSAPHLLGARDTRTRAGVGSVLAQLLASCPEAAAASACAADTAWVLLHLSATAAVAAPGDAAAAAASAAVTGVASGSVRSAGVPSSPEAILVCLARAAGAPSPSALLSVHRAALLSRVAADYPMASSQLRAALTCRLLLPDWAVPGAAALLCGADGAVHRVVACGSVATVGTVGGTVGGTVCGTSGGTVGSIGAAAETTTAPAIASAVELWNAESAAAALSQVVALLDAASGAPPLPLLLCLEAMLHSLAPGVAPPGVIAPLTLRLVDSSSSSSSSVHHLLGLRCAQAALTSGLIPADEMPTHSARLAEAVAHSLQAPSSEPVTRLQACHCAAALMLAAVAGGGGGGSGAACALVPALAAAAADDAADSVRAAALAPLRCAAEALTAVAGAGAGTGGEDEVARVLAAAVGKVQDAQDVTGGRPEWLVWLAWAREALPSAWEDALAAGGGDASSASSSSSSSASSASSAGDSSVSSSASSAGVSSSTSSAGASSSASTSGRASGAEHAPSSSPYEVNPFVLHAFLSALESSGSVAPSQGWGPRHLTVRDDETGELLGCCPLYVKGHSQGEYVFDHSWADASYRMGSAYYPKLQVCVPFTPCTGPRLMVAGRLSPERRKEVLSVLGRALIQIAKGSGISSVHVTFNSAEEWAALSELGYLQRTGIQFHWDNRNYSEFDNFLADLKQSKRKNIRQERKSVAKEDLIVRRLAGADITEAHWDAFYGFYTDTIERFGGEAYLTRAFFTKLGQVMPERVVLVVAEEPYIGGSGISGGSGGGSSISGIGTVVAAALNLLGSHCLYGRNWGCLREVKNLHFELCYYQALDHAIEAGLPRVEAGAQGMHKLQRGYMPSLTYSSHFIVDPRLRGAVRSFLERERQNTQAELQILSLEASPYKADATGELLFARLAVHVDAVNSSSVDSFQEDE
ncbi:hypothetical protein FOA52_002080 [Chlamydomonas sp. UWO 241]|nr:hypothetical protein FOA52_002080 [Chlamydomonas sp. UWO 241]